MQRIRWFYHLKYKISLKDSENVTEYVTIIKNIHINSVNFLDLLTWMIKHALRLLCVEYTYKILREDSRNSIALSRLELLQHGWSEVENCPVAMKIWNSFWSSWTKSTSQLQIRGTILHVTSAHFKNYYQGLYGGVHSMENLTSLKAPFMIVEKHMQ